MIILACGRDTEYWRQSVRVPEIFCQIKRIFDSRKATSVTNYSCLIEQNRRFDKIRFKRGADVLDLLRPLCLLSCVLQSFEYMVAFTIDSNRKGEKTDAPLVIVESHPRPRLDLSVLERIQVSTEADKFDSPDFVERTAAGAGATAVDQALLGSGSWSQFRGRRRRRRRQRPLRVLIWCVGTWRKRSSLRSEAVL